MEARGSWRRRGEDVRSRTLRRRRIKYDAMNRAHLFLICLSFVLGACEPERGIRSNRDLASRVDVDCVDRTLREAFGKVERWDYVGDGGTFPNGTSVAQFAYYSTPDKDGWATLHIGQVETGTRISHAFTGMGTQLPQATFPPALAAMKRASDALGMACRLNLSGMKVREIGQDVDALD